jgi:Family of unknown function (DUF6294)
MRPQLINDVTLRIERPPFASRTGSELLFTPHQEKRSISMVFHRVGLVFIVLVIALWCGRTAKAQSNTFRWDGQFRSGDCGSDTVSVVLDSNGNGHLKSISWTWHTHSGDYWWWGVIGYDVNGVQLWTIPFHEGPRMDDGNPPPRYNNDFDFDFPADQYNGTVKLNLASKC